MEWTMTANAPGQVCLMQGNEAIVRGAVEAGINFAASYPGSPSSQVLTMLGKIAGERNFYAEWSTNEVCAMEACVGVLEFRDVPEGGLEKLKKASLGKKRTGVRNLRRLTGSDSDLGYLNPSKALFQEL